MKPFRFAILGAGEISGYYMNTYAARPDRQGVEFAGACDLLEPRGRALAEKFGGEYFPSLEGMLGRADIDGVIILTMPPSHAALARQCLAAGKHVHVEKPLAMTHRDGLDLVALAERTGLKLGCSPVLLMGPTQQAIKQAIVSGRIGDLIVLTAENYHGRIEHWLDRAATFYPESGGPLRDVGAYPLSLLVDWAGPVAAVECMGETVLPRRRDRGGREFTIHVMDHLTVLLRFASGALGRMDVSNAAFRSDLQGIEVHGTAGSIKLPTFFSFTTPFKLSVGDPGKWETIGDESVKPAGVDWGQAIYELAAAVREDRSPRNSARLGLHVLEIMLAAEQAAREHREVAIENPAYAAC